MSPRVHRGKAKCIPPDPERMLLPFQEKWRADRSRLKLAEKSRQIGWTWSDALDTMEQAAAGVCDQWVSSRDELQAKLYLDDVRGWAKLYGKGAEALGLREIINDDGSRHSAYVLRFPTGTTVNSLSSNPDAQAGKRGTRKLDEFALHKDPQLLYEIAYPGITWGGQLAIFSTHRGSGNFFNRLIREIREDGNPKGISLHSVTLQDALEQGLLFKLQQRLPEADSRMVMDEAEYFDYIRGGCADEESFLQEYCCVPSDDASAFLPADLIASCELSAEDNLRVTLEDTRDYRGKPGTIRTLGNLSLRELQDLKDLYLGVDVGRDHDLTCPWLNWHVGGMRLPVRIIELQGVEFERQKEIIWELLSLPGLRRACIDNTGLGRMLAEEAQKQFGTYRVELVNFSGTVKEELAYPVRAAFEDRTVRVPRDKFINADFRAIRKETTAAGNIRFTAERTASGHADRFWSLALALHASSTTPAPGKPVSMGQTTTTFSRTAARRQRGMIG